MIDLNINDLKTIDNLSFMKIDDSKIFDNDCFYIDIDESKKDLKLKVPIIYKENTFTKFEDIIGYIKKKITEIFIFESKITNDSITFDNINLHFILNDLFTKDVYNYKNVSAEELKILDDISLNIKKYNYDRTKILNFFTKFFYKTIYLNKNNIIVEKFKTFLKENKNNEDEVKKIFFEFLIAKLKKTFSIPIKKIQELCKDEYDKFILEYYKNENTRTIPNNIKFNFKIQIVKYLDDNNFFNDNYCVMKFFENFFNITDGFVFDGEEKQEKVEKNKNKNSYKCIYLKEKNDYSKKVLGKFVNTYLKSNPSFVSKINEIMNTDEYKNSQNDVFIFLVESFNDFYYFGNSNKINANGYLITIEKDKRKYVKSLNKKKMISHLEEYIYKNFVILIDMKLINTN